MIQLIVFVLFIVALAKLIRAAINSPKRKRVRGYDPESGENTELIVTDRKHTAVEMWAARVFLTAFGLLMVIVISEVM